jgi:hypothetical protein
MQPSKQTRILLAVGLLSLSTILIFTTSQAQQPTAPQQHAFFHVNLDASLASSIKTQVSGRLLLFIGPSTPDGKPSESVDMQMMAITSVYAAAREIPALVPRACADIDADDIVFPAPLSHAPSGKYQVQAVLDIHHSYNYDGRSAGDIVSVPATITIPYTGASEHLGNPSNPASCESLFSAG